VERKEKDQGKGVGT